jgi:membrane fusion protein (multidrug efflux system)
LFAFMSSSQLPEKDAPTSPAAPAGTGNKNGNGKKPYVILIFAVVIIIGGYFGYNAWKFNIVHPSTDDAQLVSDVIPVSPQVSAAVVNVPVLENQHVNAGDVVVVLDASLLQAAYDQAKANLNAAVSAAQQAGVDVTLASETGSAQETKASGGISQAESSIAQAKSELQRSKGAVDSAIAVRTGAVANVNLARSALAAAEANLQRSQDSAAAMQAQVENATAGLAAAKATIESAQAAYDRAALDASRYAKLLDEGAVSAQTSDNAQAAARQTKAQLDNAKQVAAQAQANIGQQQANLKAANRQIEANTAAVAEAQDQIQAAKAQVAGAGAALDQSKTQVASASQGVGQALARRVEATGDLKQAQTAPVQVAASRSAHSQALAKIAQMRAALETARIQLGYARIVATVRGRISKKTVEVGQYVQPGTPLMTIIPDQDIWVEANFKETQLSDVKAGNPATVEVDGLPGKSFKGHVDSISAGTGATFALLPPDNATGNFTKVVQRIPVKVVFESGQPELDRLRAGMSVVATISTAK